MFEKLLFTSLVLQLTRTASVECQEESAGGNCTDTKCEAFGNGKICTQCKEAFVPINGECMAANDFKTKCTTVNSDGTEAATQTCGKCLGATFMYKGGCYEVNTELGQSMCTQASEGKCNKEAAGYFIPPGAVDGTRQSIVSCSDITGVTFDIGGSKTYKGVAECTQCTAQDLTTKSSGTAKCTVCNSGSDSKKPNIAGTSCIPCNPEHCIACDNNNVCAMCEDGLFGNDCAEKCDKSCKDCKAAGASGCVLCLEGYFLAATKGGQGKCIQCDSTAEPNWPGVDNCAKCTSSNEQDTPATCIECTVEFYLKSDGGAPSCVTAKACSETHFPTTNTDGNNVCLLCNDNDKGGIQHCNKCSPKVVSVRAGPLVTCSECTGKKLSPLNDACLEKCPTGTYDDSNICKPCHESCASCNANAEATACTACYPGYVLNRDETNTKGTCIKECTGDLVAYCKAGGCTLDVGGSKYCDQCEDGYAPVDGICTKVSSTAKDASGCKASGGKCTACSGNYALISGGCYDTQKLPGMSICTSANTGHCTMCVTSDADPQGKPCPTCPAGCAKCAGDAGSQTCSECLSGYYLSTDKCFRCNVGNGGNIQGVPNCISCVPPTPPPGPVICYVTQQKTDDDIGGSTNKSGLSTGAIAGISVAAIVVVGGLVGFLCWWFICRGKA